MSTLTPLQPPMLMEDPHYSIDDLFQDHVAVEHVRYQH
jgi:hypothetical protein